MTPISVSRRVVPIVFVLLGVVCLAWLGVDVARRARYQHQQQAALNDETSRRVVAPVASGGPAVPRVPADGIVGRLEVPRIHLSAIVAEGDDEKTLDKAVGHLPDTALPWEGSNSVLAGHRDALFRPLQSIRVGDDVRLTTPRGTFAYRVLETFVTTPHNLGVLAPSDGAELTLVTCYPFHYIGSAPKRFIVRAERVSVE